MAFTLDHYENETDLIVSAKTKAKSLYPLSLSYS